MKKIKIAIVGCSGRMGIEISNSLKGFKNCILVGAIEKKELIKKDKIGRIAITDDKKEAFNKADVIIDFSTPTSTIESIHYALNLKKRIVIGTTGLNNQQLSKIKKASKKIPIIVAPNMSIGINLLLRLVEQASKYFFKPTSAVEILDIHHKKKKDAPSGTALALGNAVANGSGNKLKKISSVKPNKKRKKKAGKINFFCKRQGKIIGEHATVFTDLNEEIVLRHKSFNRSIYATGAINAAIWLTKRKPGFYNMFDVLGIS